jgi:hypothetical protein
MKVLYSLKKDEILLEKSTGEIVDFAENTWSRDDKFFKAMFLPLYVMAKSPSVKTQKRNKRNKQQRIR